ncbi:hypothetical protein VC83_09271 [Pseudogymnoascus destructans]|uniref:Uncharacterized protein n=1 Tax=Pseudogymnoascus destructans TaxID=655981 RepID=A0A176ZZR2_9PEZI|nr:uncharacterized protein VC83_09271 [Pseudogymnoascus destructans]OAF54521.1 hypothetical protein VC83_09271 [Pseudogymnoascus destructans]
MAFHPAQPYALQQHLRDGSMGMGMGRQPGSGPDAYDDFLDQYLTFEDTDAMGGGAAGTGPGAGNGAGAASAMVHARSSCSPFLPRSAMGAHSEPSPRDTDDLMLQFPRPPQQSPHHHDEDDQQQQQQQEDLDQDHDNDHEHEHHRPQQQQQQQQQPQQQQQQQPQQQQQQQPQQPWASFPPTHASPPLRSSRGRQQTFAEHCSTRATISDSDLLSLEGIHLKSPRYPPSPPPNHPRPSTANSVVGTPKTLNSKASKGSLGGSGPSLRRKKAFSRSSSSLHAKDSPATPNIVTTTDPHIRTPSRSASRGAIRKSASINISPAKMQAQSVAALDEWTQRMAVAEAAAFEFGFGQGGIPMTPPPSARVSDTSSASEREMGGGGSRSALARSHSRSMPQTQLAAMGPAIEQGGGSLPWTTRLPPQQQQQQFTVVRNGKMLHAPAEVGEMKFVDAFSLPYGVGWGGGDFGGVLQGTEQQEEEEQQQHQARQLQLQQQQHHQSFSSLPEYVEVDGAHGWWSQENHVIEMGDDANDGSSRHRLPHKSLSMQIAPSGPWGGDEMNTDVVDIDVDLDISPSMPTDTNGHAMMTMSPSGSQVSLQQIQQHQQQFQQQQQHQQRQHQQQQQHLQHRQHQQHQQHQQQQHQQTQNAYIPTTPLRHQRSGYSTHEPPHPSPHTTSPPPPRTGAVTAHPLRRLHQHLHHPSPSPSRTHRLSNR